MNMTALRVESAGPRACTRACTGGCRKSAHLHYTCAAAIQHPRCYRGTQVTESEIRVTLRDRSEQATTDKCEFRDSRKTMTFFSVDSTLALSHLVYRRVRLSGVSGFRVRLDGGGRRTAVPIGCNLYAVTS